MKEKDPNFHGYGIRIDSGDLAYLSKKAYEMLEAAGFGDAIISASSDLDEYLIDSLKAQGATINSWGVGTNLITSKDCPAFGGVYKLAAIKDKDDEDFVPKIKLSENTEKITNPGNKTIYRIYDKATGKIRADLICMVNETFDESKDMIIFDPIETWKRPRSKAALTPCVNFSFRYSRKVCVSTLLLLLWRCRQSAKKSRKPCGRRHAVL